MANKFQIKRTSVSGRLPDVSNTSSSSYIDQGELAINTADGILYSSDGSTIIEVGANNTNAQVTDTLTVGNFTINTTTISLNGGAGSVISGNGNIVLYGNTTGLGSRGTMFVYGNGGTKGGINLSNGAFINVQSGEIKSIRQDNTFVVNASGTFVNNTNLELSFTPLSLASNIAGGNISWRTNSGGQTYLKPIREDFGVTELRLPQANGTLALTSDLTPYLENIVEDTTPQLGGNLDMNNNAIISNVAIGNTSSSHKFSFNTTFSGSFSYGYDINLTGQTFGSYGRFFAENLNNGDEGLYLEGLSSGTNGINIGFTRSGATSASGEGAWTACPDNAKIGSFNWYAINSSFGLTQLARFETTLVGSIGNGTSATGNVNLTILDSGSNVTINFPRVTGTVPVVSSTPSDGQYISYNSNTGLYDPIDLPSGTSGSGANTVIAFSAVTNTTQQIGNSPTRSTIIFANEIQESGGNNYDASTGVFTAPVDGFYHFAMNCFIENASLGAYTQFEFAKNAATSVVYEVLTRVRNFDTVNDQSFSAVLSATVYLQSGETIQVTATEQIAGATVLVGRGRFSGFLVESPGESSGGGGITTGKAIAMAIVFG